MRPASVAVMPRHNGSRTRAPVWVRFRSEIDAVFAGLRRPRDAVDDPAGVATVGDGKAARIKVDAIDQLGVHDAGAREQVKQQRQPNPVE